MVQPMVSVMVGGRGEGEHSAISRANEKGVDGNKACMEVDVQENLVSTFAPKVLPLAIRHMIKETKEDGGVQAQGKQRSTFKRRCRAQVEGDWLARSPVMPKKRATEGELNKKGRLIVDEAVRVDANIDIQVAGLPGQPRQNQ